MNDEILNAVGFLGLAGIGGYIGTFWATALAVSTPVGVLCGALILPALAFGAADKN